MLYRASFAFFAFKDCPSITRAGLVTWHGVLCHALLSWLGIFIPSAASQSSSPTATVDGTEICSAE
jgi:hypothetical protein